MKSNTQLLIGLIATGAMLTLMLVHSAPLRHSRATPQGIVDLELAGTPQRVVQIVSAWDNTLIQQAATNTYLDFLFLLSYGFLLYGLIQAAANWFTGAWRIAGKWISIAMIVAALFDAIENILLLRMLNGSTGKELIASTYMFAIVKFFLVVVGLTYLLLSAVARLLRLNKPVGNGNLDGL